MSPHSEANCRLSRDLSFTDQIAYVDLNGKLILADNQGFSGKRGDRCFVMPSLGGWTLLSVEVPAHA